MDNKLQEEMISAYLDDELDVKEREQVAKWLAEDPRAQKMLQDLQRLQNDLRKLPRHRLNKNLTRSVLQEIDTSSGMPVAAEMMRTVEPELEQEQAFYSLARADCDHAVLPSASVTDQNVDEELKRVKDSGRKRIYLWPALAVAAAVLLMVFTSQRVEEKSQNVAQVRSDALEPVPRNATRSGDTLKMERRPTATDDPSVLVQDQDKNKFAKSRRREMPMRSAVPQVNALRSQFSSEGGDTETETALGEEATVAENLGGDRGGNVESDEALAPITYVFTADAKIDIKGQLERLVEGNKTIEVLDFNEALSRPDDLRPISNAHTFELQGPVTYSIIKAITKIKGVALISSNSFQAKEKNTNADLDATTPSDEIQSGPQDRVRLIFVLPSKNPLRR